MFLPQEFIHKLEQGAFRRWLTLGFVVALIAGIGLLYNVRSYHNLATPDGMEAAQLARNLAEGRGYVTRSVTPFSMHLVKRHHAAAIEAKELRGESVDPADLADPSRLADGHPDLQQAPLYPWLLSLYMRVAPFDFDLSDNPGSFEIYQPDMLIALFNQALLVFNALLVFGLARRLFDDAVAWTSMFLFIGTDVLWRFSLSGQSTLLLLVWFLLMVRLLVAFESGVREGNWSTRRKLLALAGVGVCLGAGMLTRYAFGWLALPVAAFVVMFGGARRVLISAVPVLIAAVLVAPWIQRNLDVSGTPFGTAGYAAHQLTDLMPGDELQRSIEPDLRKIGFDNYLRKFKAQSRALVNTGLPVLGNTWLAGFFLAGCMVMFQGAHRNRIRGFALLCLPVLFVVQAVGATHLSELTPEVNTENLLVLLVPLIIIFGTSFFFLLLDQWDLPFQSVRVTLTVIFSLLMSLPFLYSVGTRTSKIAYPPYYPPVLQQYVAGWLRDNEQLMTDVPWATAWYGDRQSIFWTLDPEESFYAIHDFERAVNALYLSPRAMDQRFLSQLVKGPSARWGRKFIVDVFSKRTIPTDFPLKYAPQAELFLPDQFYLADRVRW